MTNDIREKGETLIIYPDYSVKVKCSDCGAWELHGKDTNQSKLLVQKESFAETWQCFKCLKGNDVDVEAMLATGAVQGYHVGQALNLAQAELLARGEDSRVGDRYWKKLIELRNEYLTKAVLKP